MQYQLSRVVAGPLLHAFGRPRATGLENIPASGPALLASNHLSIVDSVYLPLMLIRPVVFPAKAEYFTAKGPLGRVIRPPEPDPCQERRPDADHHLRELKVP